ncbi:MAG TPA: TadE family protein [Phycisphaerae bacterium]|nr:TadE family protein [Phycisphaerae bacterium]
MKRPVRHRVGRQARRGAALVEFALVLPLLAMLIFGIIEFAHIFFVRQGLVNAARVGARTATLSMADEVRQTLVVQRVEQALQAGGLSQYLSEGDITIEYDPASGSDGAQVVTISVPYADISLLGTFFSFLGDFTLTSSCSMYRDQVNSG